MEKKVFAYSVDYGRSDLNRSFKTRSAAYRYIAEMFALYEIKPLSFKRHVAVVTDFTDLIESIINYE